MIDRRTFLVGAAFAPLLARSSPRGLEDAIRGSVLYRGGKGFATAAHVYNERFDGVLPDAVARPLDADDVRKAVQWLVGRGMPTRPRSGGHSYAGYSTLRGGVVLDLRNLRGMTLDRRSGTVTIGVSAQLIDVYAALNGHGVTIPAGSCPSVGIGGHALGGGMGLVGRAFGLTSDNVIGARIVTADGRLRDIDRHGDPDLLWALRGGGGGNFGVVTDLTVRIHEVPSSASWFVVTWPWSSASAALDAWLHWAPHAPDSLTSVFHLETGPRVLVAGQYLGAAADLARLLAPLQGVGGATVSAGLQDYFGLMVRWAGCLGRSPASCHTVGTSAGGALERASFDAKSDYIAKPLSAAGREVLIGAIEQRGAEPGSAAILFDSYGGAINRIDSNATAFVHRDSLACIQYLSYNGGGGWLTATHSRMRPYVSGFAYQNYIDPDLGDWRHAYYGANYRRLVEVQRAVDPHHYFNFPQAVGH